MPTPGGDVPPARRPGLRRRRTRGGPCSAGVTGDGLPEWEDPPGHSPHHASGWDFDIRRDGGDRVASPGPPCPIAYFPAGARPAILTDRTRPARVCRRVRLDSAPTG